MCFLRKYNSIMTNENGIGLMGGNVLYSTCPKRKIPQVVLNKKGQRKIHCISFPHQVQEGIITTGNVGQPSNYIGTMNKHLKHPWYRMSTRKRNFKDYLKAAKLLQKQPKKKKDK